MCCDARAIGLATLVLLACGRPPVRDEVRRESPETPDAVTTRVVHAAVPVSVDARIDKVVDEELRDSLHMLSSEHGGGVEEAEDWLVAHPDRSRPALVAILRAGEHGFNIHRVLRALGRIGHPDDVSALRERLFIGYETEVGHAAAALEVNPAETAMAALLDALESKDANIIRAASRALGRRGDERARAPIEALIDQDDPGVRSAAIYSLERLGVEPSRKLLEARRKVERDAHVKKVLAEVLGKGGSKQ